MECLSPYLCMVTVPHMMVGLERMLDYRGVGLARFHCTVGHNTLTLKKSTVVFPITMFVVRGVSPLDKSLL